MENDVREDVFDRARPGLSLRVDVGDALFEAGRSQLVEVCRPEAAEVLQSRPAPSEIEVRPDRGRFFRLAQPTEPEPRSSGDVREELYGAAGAGAAAARDASASRLAQSSYAKRRGRRRTSVTSPKTASVHRDDDAFEALPLQAASTSCASPRDG
jgi:hypothetical protein